MQIHFALSEPPRWQGDERLARTAIVHLTPGLDGVSRAVNEADRGLLPAEATVVVGQPMAVDPSRAPDGSLDPLDPAPGDPVAAEGRCRRASSTSARPAGRRACARRTPTASRRGSRGTRRTSTRRSCGASTLSPVDIEAANAEHGRRRHLRRLVRARPEPALAAAAGPARAPTHVAGLWHIGASTHPGPGLGAGSGTLVAKELLRPRLVAPAPQALSARRSPNLRRDHGLVPGGGGDRDDAGCGRLAARADDDRGVERLSRAAALARLRRPDEPHAAGSACGRPLRRQLPPRGAKRARAPVRFEARRQVRPRGLARRAPAACRC